MKVSELFEGVDKRPQSVIPFGLKVAAEQLRKMGLSVRIDARAVGKNEKSNQATLTVTGDVEEAAILKVLKKNEVTYATVGSTVKGDKKVRTIRIVQPLREGKADLKRGAAVTKLMRDYKNAMAWVNAPKSEVPKHEIQYWEEQARKLRAHALKQYGMNLGESLIDDAKHLIKGVKRAIKGKTSAKETEHLYGRMARSAIDHKTPLQADKAIERFVRVGKVVSPKAYPPGYKPMKQSVIADRRAREQFSADALRYQEMRRDMPGQFEAVAEPFKTFKKGQIVTVIKTGKKVEVLGQNDIGLVQTVSTDPNDLKIKSWRDYSATQVKSNLFPAAGHQEYMPRELQEGWKMGAAAVALSGAVVAGIANSPNVEINGDTYAKAGSLRSAPADAKSTTVNINGKDTKVLYWEAYGPKNNRKMKVYAKVD